MKVTATQVCATQSHTVRPHRRMLLLLLLLLLCRLHSSAAGTDGALGPLAHGPCLRMAA